MEDAEATEDTERESLNGLTEKVIGAAMEVALRSPPRVVDGEEARRVTRVGRFTGEVDRFTREVDALTFEVDARGSEAGRFTGEVDRSTREVDALTVEVDA